MSGSGAGAESGSGSGSGSSAVSGRRGVLLLSRDLIFTSKVEGTARASGYSVRTSGTCAGVASRLGGSCAGSDSGSEVVGLVLIDLTAGGEVSGDRIAGLRELAGRGPDAPRLVAFGPHVEGEALRGALAAGCDEAMPRSKFSARLPELLRGWLGGD